MRLSEKGLEEQDWTGWQTGQEAITAIQARLQGVWTRTVAREMEEKQIWSNVRVVKSIGFGYRTNLVLLLPDSPSSINGESCLNAFEIKLSRKRQGCLF